jgi:leader peptidase (prepilin peptidase) / N-methyltransferase
VIAFDLPVWLAYLYLFVLGCVVGSFLNVCIYRFPKHPTVGAAWRGIWTPPSSCPRCGTRIRWQDNIPIFGWLRLKGRCRDCRMWISPRYPAIELLNGLLWVALYWLEVPVGWRATIEDSGLYSTMGPQGIPGHAWLSPTAVLHWRYFYHLVLVEALVVATFIDWDLWIIPDAITLPTMVVGVLGNVLIGQVYLVPVWFQSPTLARDVQLVRDLTPQVGWMFPTWLDPLLEGPIVPLWIAEHPHLHGLAVSLAGILVGGGVVWAVRAVGTRILGREAMGDGDVVLMAMVGSFLGWQVTVAAFLLAPVAAFGVALLRMLWSRQVEIPYGPYLSMGTLAVLFGWDRIWPPFERVFFSGVLVVPVGVMMIVGMGGLLVLMQLIKRMFGIELYTDEPPPVWLPADQTQYLAGEQVDPQQGQWRRSHWPGNLSGRGQLHENHWRRPGQ